jgi:hypothetical protein
VEEGRASARRGELLEHDDVVERVAAAASFRRTWLSRTSLPKQLAISRHPTRPSRPPSRSDW